MNSWCCAVLSHSIMSDSVTPPGSSVHGILQARILEWVAMPSSRGSSQHRDHTLQVDSLLTELPVKLKEHWSGWPIPSLGDLSNPGIKLGSPSLQADSLPPELPGNPKFMVDVDYSIPQ